MGQIEDFRLNSTPTVLIGLCAVLLAARVGLTIFDWQHPAGQGRSLKWTEAETFKASASNSKKLRLYEFYAAWCNPCQRLERDTLTNDEVRKSIENNFVALRVTDRQKETGKNSPFVSELIKKYRIFAFPTLVAVGSDGEPIQMLVGNASSLSLYRFLMRVLNNTRGQTVQPGSGH